MTPTNILVGTVELTTAELEDQSQQWSTTKIFSNPPNTVYQELEVSKLDSGGGSIFMKAFNCIGAA